jgi:isoleucyl-tRNA synthetase
VRQPLAEAAFSWEMHRAKAVETYADLFMDELNVKEVRLLDAATEAVSHMVKPLPKQLGQKYGNKFPPSRKAILGHEFGGSRPSLFEGKTLKVEVNGETYDVLPEEVEVKALAREGFAVAEEAAYVAALVTDLTPELVQEGLAREFVRRVQDLRKSANWMWLTGSKCSSKPQQASGPRSRRTGVHHRRDADVQSRVWESARRCFVCDRRCSKAKRSKLG